jgi:hypothetical protein
MSSTIETVSLPERAPPQSLWGAVREALAGAHGRDFTEGPIGRAIFILAVPMVLEMLMESIFVVVDVFVVAISGGRGGDRGADGIVHDDSVHPRRWD